MSELVIILVSPQHPGNIGSIARAMTNMGLTTLIAVNPCEYRVDETYRLGWGARERIDQMIVCETLDAALGMVDVAVATTNRRRDNQAPLLTPRELVPHVQSLGALRVGVVFGSETNGLSNDEIGTCHFQSHIPSAVSYPALNLSQAVMIYAYEWHLAQRVDPVYHLAPAAHSDVERLYDTMGRAIDTLPFKTRNGTVAFVNLFRRLLGRTVLETRDVRLLMKLFGLIKKGAGSSPTP
ncbi:RNA methyltransferase [bacterium]|nr:RNA methyltransferase [bacterium]